MKYVWHPSCVICRIVDHKYNVSIFFFFTFYWKFSFFCSLSSMFSAIFSIVFTMVLVSVESSTVQSAFEVALRCTKKGWQAEMDALASGPVTEEEILEDACIYLRVSITEYLYITSIHQLVLRSFLSFLKRRRATKNKNLWWRWNLQPVDKAWR